MLVRVETVEKMLQDYDDRGAMLTAFRHAANSLALEAGITKDHVSHDEAAASVCGDAYYLDLIRGAEQRMGLERISFKHQTTLLNSCEKALADRDAQKQQLSVKYEKLRAAGAQILQAHYRSEVDWNAMRDMDEVLKDD
jgi:hypothetical protein